MTPQLDSLNNEEFSKQSYWDTRFETESAFEWFFGYDKLSEILSQYLSAEDVLLTLGCGNSALSRDIRRSLGVRYVLDTDYSSTVLSRMSVSTPAAVAPQWCVADMRGLPTRAGVVDCVIEKGTLDVLFVSEKDPWRCSEEAKKNMEDTLQAVYDCLTPTGVFISITFAQPHFRLPHLHHPDRWDWHVDLLTVGETFHYFVYILRKGTTATVAPSLSGALDLVRRMTRCHQQTNGGLLSSSAEKCGNTQLEERVDNDSLEMLFSSG